jgi:hypothetical protein
MKFILYLFLIFSSSYYSLCQTTLPQQSFLQSGFDGFDFSKKENSAFRIFDLSDSKNSIQVNGKNFTISEFVQMTHIDERTENSTVGIYATYDSFFHSYTSEFKLNLGVQYDNLTVGFGYDKYMRKIFTEMSESKKVAGISQDVRYMYTLSLAPAFLLP